MTQETHCTFEQAKALKELGFPQLQELKWHSTYLCKPGEACIQDVDLKFPEVCAPTLSLVQKWLGEEKHIYLVAYPCGRFNDDNSASIFTFGYWYKSGWHHLKEYEDYITSDDALSAGIDKTIEQIKLDKNQK